MDHFVYALIKNEKPIYIGCTSNIKNRVRSHKLTPQCILCGSSDKLEIDHIIPISKGGKNELSNMQVLCSKCNNLKRAN